MAGGASFTDYPDYPDLLFTRTWLIIGGILFRQDGVLDELPQKLGNFAEFGSPEPVGNPFPTGGIMAIYFGKPFKFTANLSYFGLGVVHGIMAVYFFLSDKRLIVAPFAPHGMVLGADHTLDVGDD